MDLDAIAQEDDRGEEDVEDGDEISKLILSLYIQFIQPATSCFIRAFSLHSYYSLFAWKNVFFAVYSVACALIRTRFNARGFYQHEMKRIPPEIKLIRTDNNLAGYLTLCVEVS